MALNDGSVAVVCKHYGAICIALEAIYADAGDICHVMPVVLCYG